MIISIQNMINKLCLEAIGSVSITSCSAPLLAFQQCLPPQSRFYVQWIAAHHCTSLQCTSCHY